MDGWSEGRWCAKLLPNCMPKQEPCSLEVERYACEQLGRPTLLY